MPLEPLHSIITVNGFLQPRRLGWKRNYKQSMPEVAEVYGLEAEDRWPHEMKLDGMSTMAKKIKMGECRYAYGREKADRSRRKTN